MPVNAAGGPADCSSTGSRSHFRFEPYLHALISGREMKPWELGVKISELGQTAGFGLRFRLHSHQLIWKSQEKVVFLQGFVHFHVSRWEGIKVPFWVPLFEPRPITASAIVELQMRGRTFVRQREAGERAESRWLANKMHRLLAQPTLSSSPEQFRYCRCVFVRPPKAKTNNNSKLWCSSLFPISTKNEVLPSKSIRLPNRGYQLIKA